MDAPKNFTNIYFFNNHEFHQSQSVEDHSKNQLNLSSDSEKNKILKFQTELENNKKKLFQKIFSKSAEKL